MTCFDLFFLEKGQEAREHAHAVFDRVDAEVFAFGVEAATGRGNTVNDGSAGLGYAIGVGTAAGVDPARFKAFEGAASLMSSTSSRVFSVQGMAGEMEARRASTVMPSPQFMAASLIG